MVWDEMRPELERTGANAREAEAPFLRMADGSPVPLLPQQDMFPPVRIASLMDAMTTIADLRAVLAPLLDDWLLRIGTVTICKVCGDSDIDLEIATGAALPHKPDCPVLRRDALLGR